MRKRCQPCHNWQVKVLPLADDTGGISVYSPRTAADSRKYLQGRFSMSTQISVRVQLSDPGHYEASFFLAPAPQANPPRPEQAPATTISEPTSSGVSPGLSLPIIQNVVSLG